MEAFTQGYFYFLIVAFHQLLVNSIKLGPSGRPDGIYYGREIKGAVVHNFVFLSDGVDVAISHLAELLKQSLIHFESFQHVNKLANILVG